MARYSKAHKEATHARLVHLAAKKFREEGVDGVGIAPLMNEAGLTQGGFYAHFASKEALVVEAVTYALRTAPLQQVESEEELLEHIDWYLSPAHRDHPDSGCAIASLGPDLTRRPRASRVAFTAEATQMLEHVVRGLPASVAIANRVTTAYAVLAHMLGSLQLARLLRDKKASDAVLTAGRSTAKTLAGFPSAVAMVKTKL